jgi:hypothetical protein
MSRHLSTMLLVTLVGCSDNTALSGNDTCDAVDFPLTGEANAPVVTDVALEVQAGEGIIALATASDPQGSENIQQVPQILRVFQDTRCDASPIVVQDDLAYSGVEESFGTVVQANQALFTTISQADSWPVAVEFRDIDENITSGRVLARVLR